MTQYLLSTREIKIKINTCSEKEGRRKKVRKNINFFKTVRLKIVPVGTMTPNASGRQFIRK